MRLMMAVLALALAVPAAAEVVDPCKPTGTCRIWFPEAAEMDRLEQLFGQERLPTYVRGAMPVVLPPQEIFEVPLDPQPDSLFPWAVNILGRPLRRITVPQVRYFAVRIPLEPPNPWLEFNINLRILAKRRDIRVPEPGEPPTLF